MNRKGHFIRPSLRRFFVGITLLFGFVFSVLAHTNPSDTVPLRDRQGDYLRDSVINPVNLRDPNIIEKKVEYDPLSNRYWITEKIGEDYYRTPISMTFDEYLRWKGQQQEREYFEKLAGLSKKNAGDKTDPMSKVDFSQTQNNKLKMLLKSVGVNGKLPNVEKLDIKKMGDNLIGMIFGDPPTVDIRPQGQIDLTIGGDYRKFKNPILPTYAQTTGGLLFNMDIQMNVTGKIGEKLNLNTAFNNKATFDFDQIMKINYNSNVFGEDDIIKSIEGGNVNLPLRSSLIQGSTNLFGVKTELQFGYLRLTALAAQQKNRRQNVAIQGGAQVQPFNVPIDQYDENRHFFLSHFNRETFDSSLAQLPLINSQFSITKMEVWVSNERNEDKEVRQIVALADAGETERINNPALIRRNANAKYDPLTKKYLPDNEANTLNNLVFADTGRLSDTRSIGRVVNVLESRGLVQGRDFLKRSMKKLQPTEYTFNPKLGTLSISNVDRQQVLAVAFTYFYNGKGPFQVGEFAENVPIINGVGLDTNNSQARVLFAKLLKSTIQDPNIPLFDLMMRNVYSIGAYTTNPQDLRLDIVFQDPGSSNSNDPDEGKGFKRTIPEIREVPLLRLLNLDRLNVVGDPQPDGQFDWVPDVTINPRNGRVMFPVVEPFGSGMKSRVVEILTKKGLDPLQATEIANKYTYQELYDSTLFRAQERQEKNRFLIRGQVKSTSSNRIQLNAFGLRPGAVTVTAGAYQLVEGVDFAIDYGSSVLTVLNTAYVAPNIPLNVSYEDNALFGFQQRTMLGLRADYSVKKDLQIGATFMNLFELPYTQKVNMGDDPINNKVYGVDVNFTKDAPWLTKLVDKIPLIQTKEPSKITFSAEAAVLDPGHAKAISQNGLDKGGTVYLDDFEGSTSPFSLIAQPNAWTLASVPQRNETLFPEGRADSIGSGVNRAMLNWYRIDQFTRDKASDKDEPYAAQISQSEVFPNIDAAQFLLGDFLPTFDLHYRPKKRGPYNFDVPDGYIDSSNRKLSIGLSNSGGLNAPETRWAGIMRGLTTTDFEAANIEYIDFWMLDPFLDTRKVGLKGNMYIHLGDISEDVLRDSRKAFEHGLPSPSNPQLKTDNTLWGKVPRTEIPLPNSFSANDADRQAQDVGMDGIDNGGERFKFSQYLAKIQPRMTADAFTNLQKDPSNDDFVFFNDQTAYPDGTPITKRYERFNGLEGNSAQDAGQAVQSATNLPDAEDVNRDNSFEENEAYFQYKIPLSSDAFGPQNKFWIESTPDIKNTQRTNFAARKWHHFRIPIDAFQSKHGQITDFRAIRFMRVVMKDFDDDVVLRFAKMDLIRNQWRRYKRDMNCKGIDVSNNDDKSAMELIAMSIEENSKKAPFNYVIPPGIPREQLPNQWGANARQNEQSLGIRLQQLPPCKARAAVKFFSSDLRVYERIKMFVHAETPNGQAPLSNNTCVFMRIGSDFEKNYYEYEIPLSYSNIRDLPSVNALGPQDPSYGAKVWLDENTFDFALSLLTAAKLERNNKNVSLNDEYTYAHPDKPNHKVKIKGNPDIGYVKGIMVGVYNKGSVPQDIELWLNELRVTGLNESTSGAAIARMDLKLADFGNVTIGGNYMGIGYGAIDQRVAQRSREEVKELSFNANLELGKFLPAKSGIRIPFNYQFSDNIRTPEFDPYDLDVKLKDKLNSTTDGDRRTNIKDSAETVQSIRGFSFNNVRKDRTASERKPAPWDIENFSVSYAQTAVNRKDPLVEKEEKANYRGTLDYNFSREPLYVTPLKKVIKGEKADKYLKLLTDFNFNPIPNSFSFNTILDRQLDQTRYRFSGEDPAFNTFYLRRFSWDRNYQLQWDLTRSLKLNFDAKNFAIIDELNDFDQTTGVPTSADEKKTFLTNNLKDMGRTKRYDHNFNINYTVPTRNIPFMDWVNLRGTYGSSYGWEAAALGFQGIGNNINNRQNRAANADLNFTQLYNQIKYLRKIQEPLFKPALPAGTPKPRKSRTKIGGLEPPSVTNLKKAELAADSSNVKGKKKKEKDDEPSVAEKMLIRPLLLLRNARMSYTENFNSFVPGFLPQARQFGMSDLSKPGWDYVLGFRGSDDEWLDDAGARTWISRDIRQTRPTLNNYQQQLDFRLSVEPFADFRVDIDLTKNYTRNTSQEFRDTTVSGLNLYHTNRFDEGSYTISYFTLNTLFKDINGVYETFLNNRPIVSEILNPNGDPYPDAPGYKKGYGPTNNEVLVPAFLAAYTGRDVTTVNRDLFKEKPSMNWRLTYNGLAKLPGLRDKFTNINITHSYKSSMTVNSFRTSPFWTAGANTPRRENAYDYYPQYDLPTVMVTEQFAPLLGIDASLKSGANFGIQYRTSRSLGLSLSDSRLQESNVKELQVKFGHRIKNVYIKFLDVDLEKKLQIKALKKKEDEAAKKEATENPDAAKNKKRQPKARKGNDLVLNFDLSWRDDRAENRLFGAIPDPTVDGIPSRGSNTLRVSPSATYTINKLLDLRFYIDYNRIIPFTSASFPSTTATGGFVITYKLN